MLVAPVVHPELFSGSSYGQPNFHSKVGYVPDSPATGRVVASNA